jgi:hypothetical protein
MPVIQLALDSAFRESRSRTFTYTEQTMRRATRFYFHVRANGAGEATLSGEEWAELMKFATFVGDTEFFRDPPVPLPTIQTLGVHIGIIAHLEIGEKYLNDYLWDVWHGCHCKHRQDFLEREVARTRLREIIPDETDYARVIAGAEIRVELDRAVAQKERAENALARAREVHYARRNDFALAKHRAENALIGAEAQMSRLRSGDPDAYDLGILLFHPTTIGKCQARIDDLTREIDHAREVIQNIDRELERLEDKALRAAQVRADVYERFHKAKLAGEIIDVHHRYYYTGPPPAITPEDLASEDAEAIVRGYAMWQHDYDIGTTLKRIYVQKPRCVCNFHSRWSQITQVHPDLGRWIWEHSDHAALVRAADPPPGKRNTLLRADTDFARLQQYVASAKPRP